MRLRADTATGIVHYARLSVLGGLDVTHIAYDQRAVSRSLHDTYFVGVAEGSPHLLWARGRRWRVTEGLLVALGPGEVHGMEQIGVGSWGYRSIYPSADQLLHIGSGPRRSPLDFRKPVVEDGEISRSLRCLHAGLLSASDYLHDADAAFASTLRLLVERHAVAESVPAIPGEHEAATRAREFIHANYRQRIRIDTLAEHVGLSPYHLIRVFHGSIGIPPYTYVDELRVAKARSLLSEGLSISDAAYLTGFSDQSHLTRHFKRALGITPGVYCRSRRGRERAA